MSSSLIDNPPIEARRLGARLVLSRIVRAGGHPRAQLATYAGLFKADAYGGYVMVYEPVQVRPVVEATC